MKYVVIIVLAIVCLSCKAGTGLAFPSIKELWLQDTASHLVHEYGLTDAQADGVLDATVFSGYYDADTDTLYHWELVSE